MKQQKIRRIAGFLVLMIMSSVIFLSGCGSDMSDEEYQKLQASKERPGPPPEEKITLLCVGDNLLHMPVINSGKQEDGTYDFSDIYEKLQPEIREADIAVIGQETVFAGEEKGYSGYPLFNSPSDMGKTLYNEGFDIVLHASNHVMDKHGEGIERTLEFWKDYPEVTVLGINESQEDKDKVNIVESKNAKLAVLNYTYGTNGIPVPENKSYLVNLIDEEKIEKDVLYAEENADFTIAFMHWGTEYSTKPDARQKELTEKLCQWGVDLIIGSHPHVIEPVEWVESENGNKMLVYYSLGNFVSRQKESRNLLGGMAKVELLRSGRNVSIADGKFVPIVTHYNTAYNEFDVYRLTEYSDNLASVHGVAAHDGAVSVARFRKMVDEVFDGYDTSFLDY